MAVFKLSKLFGIWVSLIIIITLVQGQQLICENRSPEGHTPVKSEGDGAFRIIAVGPHVTTGQYVPNEVYTITIQGLKTRYSTQKFLEFLLVAESEKQAMMGHSGLITTGIFHIIDDSQTRFSDYCPDGVTSSNLKPKSEISVLWTAPSVLVASCITFKATVVERPHKWYMDDGDLNKTLCPYVHVATTPVPLLPDPEVQDTAGDSTDSFSFATTKTCCACDEAKYEVTFEGIWSKETHPKDFPENKWLLHFSDIIGASHSSGYYFWEVGKRASEGIRHVAEWGATRHLENELKAKSRHINTIIKARGLWHPNERGTTSAAFRVDKNRNMMSLVTMIGPSPDWFVGVSGFDLCLSNCTWMEDVHFDLFPYDAGTDSGITYMSPNSPTKPEANITRLTEAEPADPRSPFYDPSGVLMQPFAKAHIRRQRIYPKSCDAVPDPTEIHEVIVSENSEDISRPECMVTDWTEWSDCSVTCGKGLRMRKRTYLIPFKADMMRCDRQLEEKEMCLGDLPTCDQSSSEAIEEIDSICGVTRWSDWTPCSVQCGNGTQNRYRRYKNHLGRKKCTLELAQEQGCVGMKGACGPENTDSDLTDPDCPVTAWAEWTPCSASCGPGFRERTRFFLLQDEEPLPAKCRNVEILQNAPCVGEYGDCNIGMAEAKEICMLPPLPGPCRASHERFFFSIEKGMCVQFTYGGCKGNRNRYDTEEECSKVCGFLGRQAETEPPIQTTPQVLATIASNTTPAPEQEDNTFRATTRPELPDVVERPNPESREILDELPSPVDCIVSKWGEWSECSVDCGLGYMVRSREIIIEPRNNGQKCPKHMRKRRACRMPACSMHEKI